MLRLLSDEDAPGPVVEGLTLRTNAIDVVRVQDVGLRGQPDEVNLQWAADNDRILLSKDRSTLSDPAWERVRQGQPLPGVFLIRPQVTYRQLIDELVLLAEASEHHEWRNRVVYIPM